MYLYLRSGSVDKRLYSHVNDEAHTSSDTHKAFSFLISKLIFCYFFFTECKGVEKRG